ncbi:hypothetical protein ABZ934_11260 [Streptomyces sp. NPDC046557]|uniref:hypothetical protein n=1 Tax=Streptomyces sp. NPDC046557 TaxID=3155372 RepID=UPI0033E2C497
MTVRRPPPVTLPRIVADLAAGRPTRAVWKNRLGSLAGGRRLRGLGFRLLVPVIAIVETSRRLDVEAASRAPVVGTTWSLVRAVAAAAVVVLIAHTAIGAWPRGVSPREPGYAVPR